MLVLISLVSTSGVAGVGVSVINWIWANEELCLSRGNEELSLSGQGLTALESAMVMRAITIQTLRVEDIVRGIAIVAQLRHVEKTHQSQVCLGLDHPLSLSPHFDGIAVVARPRHVEKKHQSQVEKTHQHAIARWRKQMLRRPTRARSAFASISSF